MQWQPGPMNGDQEDENPDVIHDGAHIYMYCAVNGKSALAVVQALQKQVLQARYAGICDGAVPPVHLHINTVGGNVTDAFAIVDTIRCARDFVPVYTYAEGACYSAGTLIFIAGTRRFAARNAEFLIHPVRHWFYGKQPEFADYVARVEHVAQQIAALYAECTSISPETFREISARESWFRAQQALEYGMADSLIG